MRQRRAEVVRASEWRRVRIIGSIVAVVALIAGLFGVAHTGLVAARHIRVTGAPAGSERELLVTAGLQVGQPMVDVHPGRAVADLLHVPWVASATVERVWPATVRVAVEARRPVAQVRTGASSSGPVVEIDMTGRVIAWLPRARTGLPLLLGVGLPGAPGQWLGQSTGAGWPIGSAATRPVPVATALAHATGAVGGALALMAGIEADAAAPHHLGAARTRIASVDVAADATVSAQITPGPVTVFFGAPTLLAAKVNALVSMLRAQTFAAGSLLDLQVPDRPTLTGTAVPSTP